MAPWPVVAAAWGRSYHPPRFCRHDLLMRILHVASTIDPAQGGPVSVLAGLAPAQVGAGLDVSLLAPWGLGESVALAAKLRAAGVNVTLVGPAAGPLRRHPELAARVDAAVAGADVVHVHALWEEVQHRAAVTAYRQATPYIVTPHGMLDPWSLAQSRWKKKLYLAWRLRKNVRRAAAMHFTTRTEADLVAPLRLGPPALIETLGLDLSEFETLPPEGAFRSRYPAIGRRRIVLFLGRLHHKKGLELLIPAFGEAALSDAVLVIAGPDSDGYRAKLEAQVAERRLRDGVLFTGMLHGAERVAAFADADLFVLPSYQENFGIAVVEALAAATPVLISDQVNIWQDIVAASVGGVVKTDATLLASELRRWMTDDSLRAGAAERARPFVWQRYDWRQIARRWVNHYHSLLQPGNTAGLVDVRRK
jgi:glycosyltransferase involved in cell wall biosynthesis